MARFTNIILAYFVIGAVLWGSGLIVWSESGMGTLIIDHPGQNTSVNQGTAQNLNQLGGPLKQAISSVGGGALLAIWNLVAKLIGFLFWPIVTLESQHAPPRIIVLVGGSMTVAFYGSIFRLFRGTA